MGTSKTRSIIVETPMASIPIQTQNAPVDTTVSPVRKSGGLANELMQGLKGLSPAIQSYIDLQEANVKANRDLGAMDRIMGKSPNSPDSYRNLGWGYNQGFATLDGEIRGIQISQEYSQALEAANYFIDDPDPTSAKQKRLKLYDEISQRILQGTTNVDVLAGASQRILKTAIDTEEEAYRRFNVALYTDMLNNTRQQLTSTMVEARGSIVKMMALPPEQRNWAPIRQILTTTKQTLEAGRMSPADAAALTIDAYGEAVIGAAQGDARLAQTMLGVLDLPDASGVVFSGVVRKGEGGKLQYPLRDQIDALKRDVGVAIEKQNAVAKEEAAQRWIEDEAKIRNIIINGGSYDEWHKIAMDAVAYGAKVPWASLNEAFEQAAKGFDLTVRDDPTLVVELYDAIQNNQVFSMNQLMSYHKDRRLSGKAVMDIYGRQPTYASLAAQNRAIASNQRSLDEAEKKRMADERKMYINSWRQEIYFSNPNAISDPDQKALVETAADGAELEFQKAQESGLSPTECSARAFKAANELLRTRKVIRSPATVKPDEASKNLNQNLDRIKDIKWPKK